MIAAPRPAITSRAHDYVEVLPLTRGTLRCTRCGLLVPLASLANQQSTCTPHLESASSGFKSFPTQD